MIIDPKVLTLDVLERDALKCALRCNLVSINKKLIRNQPHTEAYSKLERDHAYRSDLLRKIELA